MLSFDNRLNDFNASLRWKSGYETTPTLQSTILDNKRDKLKLLASAIYKHGLRNYDGYITSDIKYFIPSGDDNKPVSRNELVEIVNRLMKQYATVNKEYDFTEDKKEIKKRLTKAFEKINKKDDAMGQSKNISEKIENLRKIRRLTNSEMFDKDREISEYKQEENKPKYKEALEEYKKLGDKLTSINEEIKNLAKLEEAGMEEITKDIAEILGFNPNENIETTEQLKEQQEIIENAIENNPTLEITDPNATTKTDTVIIPTGDVINE